MLKQNLKYLRGIKSISQKKISEILGISRSAYGHYETGKSEPVASILLKLSKYYKLTVNDLLTKNISSPLFNTDSLLEDNITLKNVRNVYTFFTLNTFCTRFTSYTVFSFFTLNTFLTALA